MEWTVHCSLLVWRATMQEDPQLFGWTTKKRADGCALEAARLFQSKRFVTKTNEVELCQLMWTVHHTPNKILGAARTQVMGDFEGAYSVAMKGTTAVTQTGAVLNSAAHVAKMAIFVATK
eukprot:215419-Chlamydomonas_euryale.AAC.10